ncbi:hypothetical protein L228DRAFT_270486 [Xylona heveae TC161]|uniref:Zn(2)-C6 fungal-type domain-containing protein n=1 Tax=Xylona heveae (strain CBS 132557 / TC161) TaxID=1328760 RepID=A0A165AG06_XYLHT|nr:hypothetical protein L228DRAFT_270486 [Xylona heveae TC161]KZF20414.1 hypothetical protein L228DRAFT_270486 [Xylona heveae TC161]
MPRRRDKDKTDPDRPPRVRTRSGCQTCRARKIKCDEAKPVCRRCSEKGFRCHTGIALKWEEDFLSRGLAFGRSGTNARASISGPRRSSQSSRGLKGAAEGDGGGALQVHWCPLPVIESHSFIHTDTKTFCETAAVRDLHETQNAAARHASPTSSDDSAEWEDAPGDDLVDAEPLPLVPIRSNRVSESCSFTIHPSILQSLAPFPQLGNAKNAQLLEYYLQALCPLTTSGLSSDSPFRSLILPFSITQSSNVLQSVLALAACHRSKSDRSWNAPAMRLKAGVLRDLRSRLAAQDSTQVALDPEVLITMMLMCLYEIVNNCDRRWVIHLRGARDVIRLRRQLLPGPISGDAGQEPVAAFAERFFAFQDIMGRTACGEAPLFGTEYWESDSAVDAWMGCSPALARILCAITELSRLKQREPKSEQFVLRAAAVENELLRLRQTASYADPLLEKSAELKRLGAEVYLHCALYDASPSTALVASYVKEILQGVAAFLAQGTAAGLTWPLFVAAVELDPINDELWTDSTTGRSVYGRPLVLRAIDVMASSTMANIHKTRSVVSKVWQARDLDQIEPSSTSSGSRSPGRQRRNDWETFVAPFCDSMSLA